MLQHLTERMEIKSHPISIPIHTLTLQIPVAYTS
jgi:hypothetical protein